MPSEFAEALEAALRQSQDAGELVDWLAAKEIDWEELRASLRRIAEAGERREVESVSLLATAFQVGYTLAEMRTLRL